MTAVLKERGPTSGAEDQFPYPSVVDRIANPPFLGGPRQAPTTALVPPFFAQGAGVHRLRCTSRSVPAGVDATWTMDAVYTVTIEANGTVRFATDGAPYTAVFDETRDTHTWPDATRATTGHRR